MPVDPKRVQSVFLAAVEIVEPAGRAAVLDRECGNDAELRHRVEALLHAHDEPSDEQNRPTAQPEGAGDSARRRAAGPETTSAEEGRSTRIGPYKLLQQIGEGGMGTVWMAEQAEPVKRTVALKLIKAGMDSAQVLVRFEAERQALALMDHPNIAKVFDAGTTPNGRPYFVMELVKGVPITQYCDEHQLTPRERLELFIPVCQAIQHAHQKGIIHRDIKPSNVLIASYDGKPVPKVIDFGVAKATGQKLTDKTLYTGFGGIVGTLEYMSPEQAEFNALDVDTRSDIYSLGVLLYELLTGTTPLTRQRLKEAAMTEVLRLIREEEAPKPSTRLSSSEALPSVAARRKMEPARLTRLVRGDLDWLVMKALEKDRTRRYETANGMARDVERFLAEEPIEARPPSASYRLRKFLRRNKKPMLAAALVLLALVGGIIGTTWGLVWAAKAWQAEAEQRTVAEQKTKAALDAEQTARNEAARATAEKKEKDRELGRAEGLVYAGNLLQAQLFWEAGNVEAARDRLDACRWDYRGWEHAHLRQRFDETQATVQDHTVSFTGVCFSPDGKSLASGLLCSWGEVQVKVWDAATGQELLALKGNPVGINCLSFSPNGKHLAGASGGDPNKPGEVKFWDAATGQNLFTIKGHAKAVRSVCFSPDGKRLASASDDETVKVWDPATGQELLTYKGHTGGVTSVCFSPDGKRLASASGSGSVQVWDAVTGQKFLTLPNENNRWSNSVCFSPDGKSLASASHFDSKVNVWDAVTGQYLFTLQGHTGGVNSVCFSPDGKRLASASEDQTVKVWDAATGEELLTLKGHTEAVTSVCFSPDGKRLASNGDGTLRLWDAATGQAPLSIKEGAANEHDSFASACFSPDSKWLASAGPDNTVKLWDAVTGKDLLTLQGHTASVTCVCFSPDGKRLASASGDKVVKIWDTATAQVVFNLKGHTAYLTSVCFSPDGKRLASASNDKKVKLWDAATGQELLTLIGDTSDVQSVCFSPNGKRIASAGGTVRLWDAATGKELFTLKGNYLRINCVCFSPDGKRLVGANMDHTLKLWDAATGKDLLTFKGHTSWVTSVCFSPDGERIVSASVDKTVKVWDAATGQELLTLKGQGFQGYSCIINFNLDSCYGRHLSRSDHDSSCI